MLPVLLSLVGPSPHDASIVMEDFYRPDDSSEEGDTNKNDGGNNVELEMKDTKVEVIDGDKANGVTLGAQPV